MSFKSIIASAVLLMSCALTTSADNILGIDGEESTSVGIYIKEISTGKVLVDHNSHLALTPASVMKAITTATALSVKGADGHFDTKVALRGVKGNKGEWNGDIVVTGVADPTLESEYFRSTRGFGDSIVAALRRRGIKQVNGAIVVNESLRDAGPVMKWELEDIAWPYGAGLYGFNYRDNCVVVYPGTGRTKPEVPGLDIQVVKTSGRNDLVRGAFSDRLMVYTRDPGNTKWALSTTVPDPSAVFIAELTKKMNDVGIKVGTKASAPNGETTTIYTHQSPTYADIMHSLMVRSDNLFAEGMLRLIAPTSTRTAAIKREKQLWATRGINTRYTIINDGSGLTRANRLSAHFIGDVLEWMANSPQAETYASFFPRAGKDGTLRGFLAKSPLKGTIALKTGSVSSVQCYAGYRLDKDDKPTHVVVIMVNGFFCPREQVRRASERLLDQTFN